MSVCISPTLYKVCTNTKRQQLETSLKTSHQFRAELLFEPLFVTRKDGWIFETTDGLREQDVEAVFHGEHQQ